MEKKEMNISEFLKKNGIRPSNPRIEILGYLLREANHPTIDMIYRSLSSKLPKLSKTTVYNTLNLFIEKKITSIVLVEENETRYDGNTKFHGHFKCEVCEDITDFELGIEELKLPDLENATISEEHLYLKGICKSCK